MRNMCHTVYMCNMCHTVYMRNICHTVYLFDLAEVIGHTLVNGIADTITLLLLFDKWNERPLKHVWGADDKET